MKKYTRETKGITLVALVITIIIIIILSTVAINMAFGENGLITQAQKAKDMGANSTTAEQEEMNSLLEEYSNIMSEGNEIEEPNPPENDETPPVVTVTSEKTTSNSIKVNVTAIDNESGMTDSPTYTYSIKQSSQDDNSYTTPSDASNITTSTYTFTGLTQGTSYDVKVEVNGDKAGNIGIGYLTNQVTGEIPDGIEQGAITFGNVIWSRGVASITISTNKSYTIQYQVNSTEGTWNAIGNGETIGNLNHNDTVYARLTDGNNYGDYASVTIKDEAPPTISNIATSNITYNSVTVTVTASDEQSGLATSGTYKYYLNSESTPRGTNTTGSYTFTGLSAETGYTIKVVVADKANNETTETTTVRTAEQTATNVNELEAGDYVYYTDGKGTRRTCVVLYDSSSSYGVEIITMENVENVNLGNGTTGTTASSKDSTLFNTSMNSYNNAIKTLNDAAASYNNGTYSSRARCVGSVPNNPSYDAAGMHSTQFGSSYDGKLKDGDTNYETDWNQMSMLDIQNIGEAYWLASRQMKSSSISSDFYIRSGISNGNLGGWSLGWWLNGDDIYSYGRTSGLRPIFLLKSNIKVTGGTGEEGSPYTLGT